MCIRDRGKTLCLCLAALAMDLIWGYAGILSLGHMAFFALGGYMTVSYTHLDVYKRQAEQKAALVAHVIGGTVAGFPLADLSSQQTRDRAYTALEAAGSVPLAATSDEVTAAVAAHRFVDLYAEPDPAVTGAAQAALGRISLKLGAMQMADLAMDAMSLAAIYFLCLLYTSRCV